jgi:hypothetical protein
LSEDILQAKVFKWFHNTYCTATKTPKYCIFAVPNGGYRTTKEAMKLKATGVVSGVSDLIVVLKNKTLYVELKTATGKQSPDQLRFQTTVEALGHKYYLVRTLEQFQEIIKSEL